MKRKILWVAAVMVVGLWAWLLMGAVNVGPTVGIGSVCSNNVEVTSGATILDFWAGSNVTITQTNRSGHADVTIAASGGLTNKNVNSFVIFTNNQVSISVDGSGNLIWTNYAGAALGGIIATNGGFTNAGKLWFGNRWNWQQSGNNLVLNDANNGGAAIQILTQGEVTLESDGWLAFATQGHYADNGVTCKITRPSDGTLKFEASGVFTNTLTATNGFTVGNQATYNVDSSGNQTNAGHMAASDFIVSGSGGRMYNNGNGGMWFAGVFGADANHSTLAFSAGTVGLSDNGSGALVVNTGSSSTTVRDLSLRSMFMATNALANWPTAAASQGGCAFVNSNATVYLLTSTPGSTTWAATNKLAGP